MYSISVTISPTIASIRRRSASTGRSFSCTWMADQSRASAPMSMSSSTERERWPEAIRFEYATLGYLNRGIYTENKLGNQEGPSDLLTSANRNVLKAHVKCSIRPGGKGLSFLANDVLGSAVIISHRVFDLYFPNKSQIVSKAPNPQLNRSNAPLRNYSVPKH